MKTSPIILILMVSLVVSAGCAKPDWIQQTLVTVDVTGTWQSTGGGLLQLDLEQQGSKVKGSFQRRGLPQALGGSTSGAIEGTVAGDVFRFSQTSGTFGPIQGEMTVSGDEMSGKVTPNPIGSGVDTLRRVNSPAPPRSQ